MLHFNDNNSAEVMVPRKSSHFWKLNAKMQEVYIPETVVYIDESLRPILALKKETRWTNKTNVQSGRTWLVR